MTNDHKTQIYERDGTSLSTEAGATEDFGDHHDRAIGPDVKQRDLMKGQTQSGV